MWFKNLLLVAFLAITTLSFGQRPILVNFISYVDGTCMKIQDVNKRNGCLLFDGTTSIPMKYDVLDYFAEGIFIFQESNKKNIQGLINAYTGEIILEAKYEGIKKAENGYARVFNK
ncbi:MAG: WG repeat-containing protein, partial [Bacteroidota bacterium]